MAPVQTKKKGTTYRCQDCGLVITVTDAANKPPHGELMCCNERMK